MADVNVNAPTDQAPTMGPPTRTDDQILPHIRWIVDKVDKSIRRWRGRKCFVVFDWCDLKGISESVFDRWNCRGSSESSEEVGVL
nr:hypothetical protein [Tanacetum cinerariifolium]GFC40839.1 hypothetical protein [Tanacetum cinerariifolium]